MELKILAAAVAFLSGLSQKQKFEAREALRAAGVSLPAEETLPAAFGEDPARRAARLHAEKNVERALARHAAAAAAWEAAQKDSSISRKAKLALELAELDASDAVQAARAERDRLIAEAETKPLAAEAKAPPAPEQPVEVPIEAVPVVPETQADDALEMEIAAALSGAAAVAEAKAEAKAEKPAVKVLTGGGSKPQAQRPAGGQRPPRR